MNRSLVCFGSIGFFVIAGMACSAAGGERQFGDSSNPTTGSGGSTTSAGAGPGRGGSSATGDGGDLNLSTGAQGGSAATCTSAPGDDGDGDGWTDEAGDCNDCDPNVNPGAIEVVVTEPDGSGMIPPAVDENCNGQVDEGLPTCDDGLALEDIDPMSGARAIDLCQTATPEDRNWGVLDATYAWPAGGGHQPSYEVGIFDRFGPQVNVQRGTRMLALSSGRARRPGDPEACYSDSCYTTGPTSSPPGFPQPVPGCEVNNEISDGIGFEVRLRAPTNATGYKYNFKFYSFEFPEFVCTEFNDQFIALVDPPPMGSIGGNISFDSKSNPVSVNIAFFDVCDPRRDLYFALLCQQNCPEPPSPYCPSGTAQLEETGFDGSWADSDAGATSWLQTTAPIGGGEEFSIRFAIWDTGDESYDSTVLVDGFEWIATGGTVAIGTNPIDDPK